jgi:hypothetical protein
MSLIIYIAIQAVENPGWVIAIAAVAFAGSVTLVAVSGGYHE